jgi:DNA-binding Lrp family transcriptional regulator
MNIIGDKLGVWLATIIVALLTIFSDKILERIRFKLNVADARTKYFEELAVNLSTYLFWSEIYHERHQKRWADDPEDMAAIDGKINAAVTTITTKEYVYRAWVRRYWDPAAAKQFDEVITAVKSVDDAIHAFNDPGKDEEKTIELGKRLDTLRAKIDQWLVHYSRNQSLELPAVVAVDESEPLGMIPMSSYCYMR